MCRIVLVLLLFTFTVFQLSTAFLIVLNSREVKDDTDEGTSGLYNGFYKVAILNNTNFKQEIFKEQKNKFWLVEFYNHWCGYCIRFVTNMKAFATEIYDWRDVVRIGTIDCANSMNTEICRDHQINMFPSMRIFPPNSKENFLGLDFGKESETTRTEMIGNLTQILKTYYNSQKEISGPVNLKPLRQSSLDRIRNEIPLIVIYLVLVFEPEDSLVGSQLALDLSQTSKVQVRLVDPKNKNLSELVGMQENKSGAVVLKRIKRNVQPSVTLRPSSVVMVENNDLRNTELDDSTVSKSELDTLVRINDIRQAPFLKSEDIINLNVENFTREGLNEAVRMFLISRGIDIAPELPKVPIINMNVSIAEIKEAIRREKELKKVLHVKHLTTVVFQMDLEAAVTYAMTKEVSLKKDISGEQFNVLKEFLNVLIKYFPTDEQGKRFFTELKEKQLDNKTSVSGEDFRNTFKELEEKYNPFMSNLEWVGCRGTIPNLRGYPCGLWIMFHTLLVSEELQDRNIPHEKPEVLNAMVVYIRHFFSCSQCALHFSGMAETISGNVTTQRDAVMWLWKAHNSVNRRLAGDITEDPRHSKVQFPPQSACHSCYASDGSWNESEVFNFISLTFSNPNQLNIHDLPSYRSTTTPPPSDSSTSVLDKAIS